MTRLSNRQYPMLRIFAEGGSTYFMRVDRAKAFDQRPFRSMLVQGWVAYRPGKGFHITREGTQAWHEFIETDIKRKNVMRPLTSYFDPLAYGLQIEPRPHKVPHEVHSAA